MSAISILYAANRPIGLRCLNMLLTAGLTPAGLLIAEGAGASAQEEMQTLVSGIPVLSGKSFRSPENVELLRSLKPDYLISVHFPYIIPKEILTLPRVGTLNLHPAFLPFNRGWNTPTWAIVEGTPFGATLHWIDEGIDTGNIALQEHVEVLPTDTAHELYQRALQAEERIFERAIPLLQSQSLPRLPQSGEGTSHAKGDIERIRDLDACTDPALRERIVRGLTTNDPEETAYRTIDGKRTPVRFGRHA
ncbi:MAG: formyltransferase family protein [Candidatus Peribacteraceae bacterium]|nr:formyltransferase family protein [Candidatus Peribacteraceae bacterium]MDD5741915.1 formyltransferase family protein [Candidatus Peribacteraceae bacterium]